MPRLGQTRQQSYTAADLGMPMPDNDIMVDLGEGENPLHSTFEMDADGNVDEAGFNAPSLMDTPETHGDNLALVLDEDHLDKLGQDIAMMVEDDIEERRPWRERFERGLEMMGLIESDIDDGPFPGASNAVHPLLIEAVTQFWARAMGELFPPEGPCKGKVMGAQTEDKNARAERVAEYMNYEMTIEDEAYIQETSRLLWHVPFHGNSFRKTYRDPILQRNVGIYVSANDLIVPAEATSLKTAQRFTHRMFKSKNELTRLQIVKHYRKADIDLPTDETRDEIMTANDEMSDAAPDGDDKSNRYEIFETCIDIDLEGDDHVDENGEPTGLERSYVVSIERASRKVLAIYRAWDEDDPMCNRKVYIEKYDYIPGPGFYGLGLFHCIGGLQTAATGAIRVLLDSAASASLSGGFISKNANIKGQRLISTPGQWIPVDATTEDLKNAFFPLPVKEPSPVLMQMVAHLEGAAQRFTATTELMTGDESPKNAPVGTTQQMIEQGGKVMSTIHRMAHASLGRELRLRYELCQKYVPEGGYPYEVSGQQRTVYVDDFAPGVSVIPVSDPNIFSTQQRMAQAQGVFQMAVETGVVPIKIAARRMLQAMRVPDIDELLPADPKPISYDPIGEVQAIMLGKPVMVTPEQNHVAHLQVLWAFMSNPQYGGNPEVQKQVGPAAIAIIGQHMAYAWATHARGLGAPAGYMDPQSGQMSGNTPPEQIAEAVAQMAPALAQVAGLPVPAEEGKDGKGQNEIQIEREKLQIEREKHQQGMQMQQEKHQFELQREQAKLQAEQQMARLKAETAHMQAQMKAQIDQQKSELEMQTQQRQAQMQEQQMQTDMQMQRVQSEQQMHMDAQSMEQEQAMGQQKMAMEGQQMEQEGQMKAQSAQQDMQIKQQQSQQPRGNKLNHLRNDPSQGQ